MQERRIVILETLGWWSREECVPIVGCLRRRLGMVRGGSKACASSSRWNAGSRRVDRTLSLSASERAPIGGRLMSGVDSVRRQRAALP